MKILAVSDETSNTLESMVVRSSEKLKDINLILACGDLDRDYMEFLVDGLDKEFFFVSGNHVQEEDDETYLGFEIIDRLWDTIKTSAEKIIKCIAGQEDLHGRVSVFRDYLIAGFGGSRWYNGRGNQFKESEMARVVNKVITKIRFFRMHDKLLGLKRKEIIVISHAPPSGVHDQSDLPHTGFKCFHKLIKKMSPLLWLHGHVHLQNARQSQITMAGNTTVVNCCGYKFIKVERKKIQVSNKYDI
ncbi:MAG: metallophosphoesterase [Elusimicrobiota bacterium]